MSDPFAFSGPALLSFSGGATSGYMLWRTLQANGGALPDAIHVTFANTGKEREETLRFVHECGTRWNVPIIWLERGEEEFQTVGYNSASRDGEPFSALLRKKRYLPNSVTRFCTIELKIRVMRDYARSLGWDHWKNVIGLRHDEKRRVDSARARSDSGKERWVNHMPLDDAKISVRDVKAFWDTQDFRLNLLPFEGNCDGCFLKARPKLWEVERTKPGTLQWWAEAEAEVASLVGKSSGTRFVTEYSYAELIRDVQRQPDLFAGVFDNDADIGGECGEECGVS